MGWMGLSPLVEVEHHVGARHSEAVALVKVTGACVVAEDVEREPVSSMRTGVRLSELNGATADAAVSQLRAHDAEKMVPLGLPAVREQLCVLRA